ncbi:MAG TPA: PadR family transcriptional regulator [Solirubrobacteraceae bacterium]|nr:PadR family transcriptional regulator [Solirubrobacteraceae bacterium]
MPSRKTTQAAAESASVEAARAALEAPGPGAPSRGAGGTDPLIGDLRRAGVLPLLVLHFVSQEPSYGNQLMDRIGALTAGALAVNPNTMYPLLRSLEADGHIAGEWEHPERRSRRFYRITDSGRGELERLAGELRPRLDRIADSIDAIRAEVL